MEGTTTTVPEIKSSCLPLLPFTHLRDVVSSAEASQCLVVLGQEFVIFQGTAGGNCICPPHSQSQPQIRKLFAKNIICWVMEIMEGFFPQKSLKNH